MEPPSRRLRSFRCGSSPRFKSCFCVWLFFGPPFNKVVNSMLVIPAYSLIREQEIFLNLISVTRMDLSKSSGHQDYTRL